MLAYPLDVETVADLAEIAGLELVVIDEDTHPLELAKELRWNQAYYSRR